MSSLIVEVCKIEDIEEHGNADALEIAVVKSWRCITRKGQFSVNQKVVYFPVDCVLPLDLSDRLGVTKYLSKGRIRAAKLRGVISCGLVIDCEDPSWEVGKNVADHYRVKKWEPPEVHSVGNFEKEDPMFFRYTDIENIRNFPDVLQDGEEVVITEKIHGTNCRCGRIKVEYDGKQVPTFMAGSHNKRRTEPEEKDLQSSLYWLPFADHKFKGMMQIEGDGNIIAFCEVFGDGVQDLKYGMERGQKTYRIFDIMKNGEYVGHDEMESICRLSDVPMVPTLYRGPWNSDLMNLASGKSTIAPDQILEGIVIKPVKERWNDNVGRVILKCISDEYLVRKEGTEKH